MESLKILVLIFSLSIGGVMAQSKSSDIVIKTKIYCDHCAECGSCEERIMNELRFTKGIKSAKLDIEKQEIAVTYFPAKITIQKIKEAVNKSGFDADDQLADIKYVSKLDACCLKK